MKWFCTSGVGSLLLIVSSVTISTFANHEIIGTPPNFTSDGEPPATYVVDVQQGGNNLVLPCEVSGTSPITVSWFREGILIRESTVDEENNGTLSIRVTEAEANVAAPREGTNYHCEATNRIGLGNYNATLRSRNVSVSRYFFESRESAVATIEGGDVALECAFNPSNPAPNIAWFTNGVMITETSRIQFLEEGRYLYIQRLTAEDRAMRYHCEVNQNGVPIRSPTTYTLNTNISDGITVYYNPRTVSGMVNQPVELVFAAAARDSVGHLTVVINCPRDNSQVTVGPSVGTSIPATLTEAARNADQVDFTCQLSTTVPPILSEDVMVTIVLPKPTTTANIISSLPNDTTLTDREHLVGGGSVEYSCEVSGSPAPTIMWYYNGAVVQSGSVGVELSFDRTQLTISAPRVNQSGIYQCFARNQFGNDSRAWILEVRRPVIDANVVGAIEDSQGYLIYRDSGTTGLVISVIVNSSSCPSAEPTCDSCPEVEWTFNGASITYNPNYIILNCSNITTTSPYNFTLTILNLTSATSGIYSAVFTYLGASETISRLLITVPVPVSVLGISLKAMSPQPAECVLEGSNVLLTCNVTGVPRPTITFMKDGESLIPGQDTVTATFMNQIRIADIDQDNEGMYSCTASDGSSRPLTELKVCDEPGTPIIMGMESPREGDDLSLGCTANGTPTPNVTWTNEDDVELASSQSGKATHTIMSVTPENDGVYKCTATNAAGTESDTITVKVKRRGVNIGLILGVVIAVVAVLVVIGIILVFVCYKVCMRKGGDKEAVDGPFAKRGSRTYTDTPHAKASVASATYADSAALKAKEAMEMSNVAPTYDNPKAVNIQHETTDSGLEYAVSNKNKKRSVPKKQEVQQQPADDLYAVPDKSKKKKNEEENLTYTTVSVETRPAQRQMSGSKHQPEDRVEYADIAHPPPPPPAH